MQMVVPTTLDLLIMISELLFIAAGALIASVSSFVFFYLWERKKTTQTIKNTQKIINDEFYMMRSYAVRCTDFITQLKQNRQSMSELAESIFYDIPRGHEPAQNLIFSQPFMFWNSIASSGSLINLPSRDIVLVNDFYKHVESLFGFNKEDYVLLKSRLKDAVLSGNEDLVRAYCDLHILMVAIRFFRLTKHFDQLCEYLDWLKPRYSSIDLDTTMTEYPQRDCDPDVPFTVPDYDDFDRKTPV